MNVRTCACCGKTVTAGYVWDGTDTFCSKECAAHALDNDMGCIEILLDDGRKEWQSAFAEVKN
ncbi:MAG: hypothetical protein J6I86_01730 [Bacteroidaceae bacterium]|nr:hypothetical protein [Bacteroidaceae bacterium]